MRLDAVRGRGAQEKWHAVLRRLDDAVWLENRRQLTYTELPANCGEVLEWPNRAAC